MAVKFPGSTGVRLFFEQAMSAIFMDLSLYDGFSFIVPHFPRIV